MLQTSHFACEGTLDHTPINVYPSSDCGVLSPYEDKRICSQYDECVILFHECLFSPIGCHFHFQ